MRHTKRLYPILLLLGILAAGGLALFALTSEPVLAEPLDSTAASYAIPWQAFASGGSLTATSASYTMQSTIGQPVAGDLQSAAYKMCSGFWCGIEEWVWDIFLPLALRF
ncbi:MAG TPA: hypothetical protein VGA03_13360 [Anaerolineales bacterium]